MSLGTANRPDLPQPAARWLIRPAIHIGAGVSRRILRRGDGLQADTRNFLPADQIATGSDNARHSQGYLASSGRLFWCTVGSLPIAFEDYVFVDLGSGRGRVIVMAADLPFRRIEGIEFAQEFHETAVEQVATLKNRDSERISLHHMDVLDFDFPSENMVIYIYNSFQLPIMQQVAENLKRSYELNRRDIYLVYCNPLFRSAFDDLGFPELGGGWTARLLNRVAGMPLVIYHLSG